jgi:hypothetical protein
MKWMLLAAGLTFSSGAYAQAPPNVCVEPSMITSMFRDILLRIYGNAGDQMWQISNLENVTTTSADLLNGNWITCHLTIKYKDKSHVSGSWSMSTVNGKSTETWVADK